MEPRVGFQEWTTISQEFYLVIAQWLEAHPDAPKTDRERIVESSLDYLRVYLLDDLRPDTMPSVEERNDSSDSPSVPLIRLAPAVWRCHEYDDLVVITGLWGYRDDGRRLYLKAAQRTTGIPLHEIVRSVDDPADPYAPLVDSWMATPHAHDHGIVPMSTDSTTDKETVVPTGNASGLPESLWQSLLPNADSIVLETTTMEGSNLTVTLTRKIAHERCPDGRVRP